MGSREEISTASESTHGFHNPNKLVRTIEKRFTKTAETGSRRTEKEFKHLTLEEKILSGAFNPVNMPRR